MANRTNASTAYYSYEYYLDYLDLIPVDEKKLKANKHSIVIAFWVSLAAFVVFLFLLLLSMSWPASPQTRKVRTGGGMNNAQHHPTCPWSLGLNLPVCVWKQPQHQGAPQGTPSLYRAQSRKQVAEHRAPPSSCSGRVPPPRAPATPRATLLSSGNWPSMGTRTAPADARNFKPNEPPLQTEPLDGRTNSSNQGHC
ncbi:LOW QUALITY PROTEIN: melanocortin-2 receptor accessory protein [Mesoplodon densirostris]|uniref:LOW QUALITY PROTEIN: melanocortin-2 receptor accessory protein n=1 Tax=Mesoplodon densirostris TaxID=48708 RepID=UPI0028DBDEAF|nr:LOW QUALITY PROTEIN: melanocortin-2 receptor accessory protein [Mesoplodon densirostris]